MTLFTRVLAVHLRTAEPMRYNWRRDGLFCRLWRWWSAPADWEGSQW